VLLPLLAAELLDASRDVRFLQMNSVFVITSAMSVNPTLIKVYAKISNLGKRIHLDKILIFSLQLPSQILQLLSSKLPVSTLGRLPVVGRHGGDLFVE
jgi:hypothetical protein